MLISFKTSKTPRFTRIKLYTNLKFLFMPDFCSTQEPVEDRKKITAHKNVGAEFPRHVSNLTQGFIDKK